MISPTSSKPWLLTQCGRLLWSGGGGPSEPPARAWKKAHADWLTEKGLISISRASAGAVCGRRENAFAWFCPGAKPRINSLLSGYRRCNQVRMICDCVANGWRTVFKHQKRISGFPQQQVSYPSVEYALINMVYRITSWIFFCQKIWTGGHFITWFAQFNSLNKHVHEAQEKVYQLSTELCLNITRE